MHHQEIVSKVTELQKAFWGGFYKKLPDLKNLTVNEQLRFFQLHGQEMWKTLHNNEIGFAEVFRFIQERDVTLLLVVICMWGSATQEDIPFTSNDLQNILHCMQDMSVGFVSEEDVVSIRGITTKLIAEGIRKQMLPEMTTSLLDRI